ncbi:MAG: beta-galactosidase trimerization domain-containing protein [Ekhidna sp.]|nr:beta-galactosidase trimerization domain-containing protein [Ekhidna sp.]
MAPVLPDELKERLKMWVEDGGILILGPMSGFRSEYWTAYKNHALGDFGIWTGIEVDTRIPIDPYNKAHASVLKIKSDYAENQAEASLWSEAISSENGMVKAKYVTGMHDEKAAIIENSIGKGKVVYLGADPGYDIMKSLYLYYASEVGIKPLASGDKDVVVVERARGKKESLFVINLTNEPRQITLKKPFKEMMIGEDKGSNSLELKPFEVLFGTVN